MNLISIAVTSRLRRQSAGTLPRLLIAAAPAFLLVLLLASITAVSGSRPKAGNPPGKTGGSYSLFASVPTIRQGPEHYLRSGRWRADTLTLIATLRYLLEPEPVLPTNYVPVNA